MVNLKPFLKKIDLFGYKPYLSIQKHEHFGTVFGGIVALVYIIAILLLIYFYSRDLLEREVPIVNRGIDSKMNNSLQINDFYIIINNTNVTNPISLIYRESRRESIEINNTDCFELELFKKYFQLNSEAYKCYFNLKNTLYYNLLDGQEAYFELVTDNQNLDVYYSDSIPSSNNYSYPFQTLINKLHSTSVDVFLNKATVLDNQAFLNVFDENSYYTSINKIIRTNSNLKLRASSYEIKYFRSYTKIHQSLSYIYCFCKILYMVINLLLHKFEYLKFKEYIVNTFFDVQLVEKEELYKINIRDFQEKSSGQADLNDKRIKFTGGIKFQKEEYLV